MAKWSDHGEGEASGPSRSAARNEASETERDAALASNSAAARPHQSDVLEGLYKNHWHDLCRFVKASFGAGPPDPEDVAQLAFLRVAKLGNAAAIENPKSYLWRAARNIVLSEWKTRAQRSSFATEVEESHLAGRGADFSPEIVLLAKEQIEIVDKVVAAMPEKRRQMLLMHRLDGMTFAEIARRLDRSQTNVKKQVARAMAEIEVALSEK